MWPSSCQQFPLPLPRDICCISTSPGRSVTRSSGKVGRWRTKEAQERRSQLSTSWMSWVGIYGGFMVDLWEKKHILIPVQVVQPNTGFQDVSGCKLSAIDIKIPALRGFSSIHVFTQKYLGGWRKEDQIGELESLIEEHWTHEMGTT